MLQPPASSARIAVSDLFDFTHLRGCPHRRHRAVVRRAVPAPAARRVRRPVVVLPPLRRRSREPEAIERAKSIWAEINGPNLEQNVLPTRARADLVLRKGAGSLGGVGAAAQGLSASGYIRSSTNTGISRLRLLLVLRVGRPGRRPRAPTRWPSRRRAPRARGSRASRPGPAARRAAARRCCSTRPDASARRRETPRPRRPRRARRASARSCAASRSSPRRGQDDDRAGPQVVRLAPVGRLVLLGLAARPAGRAGCVLTFEGHATCLLERRCPLRWISSPSTVYV